MAIQVRNISVSFPGVKALQNVDLNFENGRIHAVLGANGSGKSTLVKVLTGIYHPDKGCGAEITIDGKTYQNILSPVQAGELGIRVVHQESPLLNTFTVGECIALFKGYPKKGFAIDYKAIDSYVARLLSTYDIAVSPDTLVDDLSASERNMVAMAMAIGEGKELEETKALILDEADASIPASEAESFLKHVRAVADRGIPVIMVTHRLEEVMNYCDEMTIFNGGKKVYQGLVSETPQELIVSKMIRPDDTDPEAVSLPESNYSLGQIWEKLGMKPWEPSDQPVLTVKGLYAENINGLDFTLKRGEILGIIGVPDSGVRQLPEVLAGDAEIFKGEYNVDGTALSGRKLTPRRAFRAGVSVLPADRPVRGGIMSLSLRDNVLMPNEGAFWNRERLAKEVMEMSVDAFDVQPGNNIHMAFGKFSGGNQQKAIMAKWLTVRPKVFVLDDPTYGVDPGSRLRIFDNMKKAAQMNVGVIVFSTEPEQLINVCTRILILREGKAIGELTGDDGSLTRENIARWCYI